MPQCIAEAHLRRGNIESDILLQLGLDLFLGPGCFVKRLACWTLRQMHANRGERFTARAQAGHHHSDAKAERTSLCVLQGSEFGYGSPGDKISALILQAKKGNAVYLGFSQ